MSHSIIYGAIGFILGGLTGGFLVGTWFGKEYKKRIDRLEYENEKLRDDRREKKAEELKAREKKADEHKLAKVTAEEIVKKTGYMPDDSEDEEDVDLDDVEFDDPFEESQEDIRLISKTQYNEDVMLKESETLTYYQQDGILADAFDDAVQNATNVVGIDAIEKADEAADDDILYVSNDVEDKVYEIIVNATESFYRDVL